MTHQKRFALIAVNDDETTCCVCGKIELKRVMWITELDSDGNAIGDVFHCGTTCGAKLMGQKMSTINRVVKNFDDDVSQKRWFIQQVKRTALGADEILRNWSDQGLNFQERRATPEWETLRKIEREAAEFANNQEIKIEIK